MSLVGHPMACGHYHFARVWAGRHDDRVHVFANGHVYDRAERRRCLRQLIGVMRREKERLCPN